MFPTFFLFATNATNASSQNTNIYNNKSGGIGNTHAITVDTNKKTVIEMKSKVWVTFRIHGITDHKLVEEFQC